MNCLGSKQISDVYLTWLGVKRFEGSTCKIKRHTMDVKYLSSRRRNILSSFLGPTKRFQS